MNKINISNTALELTKELISIPSFIESNNILIVDETNLAEFVIDYVNKNIPWLNVFREPIKGTNRFNIIAYNSTKPKIIFVSHMDTVKPSGDTRVRLKPTIMRGKLFGLGSADMKSGLACSLIAAQFSNPEIPLALVFDCDEEFYFCGIKQFIEDFKSGYLPIEKDFKPDIVIFPEPSDLKIANGCRGCVEIAFRVIGKTAHSGKPKLGINAIEMGVELVRQLKELLNNKNLENPLGQTTVNLAGLNGGVLQDGQIKLQANAISNVADMLLDIRTADAKQTAEYILNKMKLIAKELKIGLENITTNLDLKGYLNQSKELGILENAMQLVTGNVVYRDDLSSSGYGELALLGEKLSWNTANFGPGDGISSHTIDEALNIKDLDTVINVYMEIFKLLGMQIMKK